MDDIDSQQQKEIHDLQKEDVKHWREIYDLGHKATWIQRNFALIYILIILGAVIFFLVQFNNYEINIQLIPK